ncbi:hypothetical protein KSP40_PGU002534 [Platanthera guangdongensis]|uniref:Uncharacterized protein n=1 Tax=Platanthera guangdongensis TaxID=2320717 RepID=A0ABR2N5E8_9ASPA
MNGKSASPPAGCGTTAPPVSDGPDDISKLFPLSSCRSQLIPPAPNRRRSAIDFLHDFCGSSWIAYGASSLLVISHFPSPLPAHESLVGPFFRQVIEPSTCGADNGADAVNAVSWCPVRPSEGEVAAAQGNSIGLYLPRVDNETGSFCWGQITGILQSSMVEAIEWTGSGDGIIAAGVEVVFWQRKGRSWVMAWKSVADVPQVLVSATWSAEGFFATSAGCLLTSKVEKSLNLANGGCKHVSVYQHYGKSEVLKIQLYHPQPISSIRWRTSTSISLTKCNLLAWRDVLLTCCLDGTVRLWSEIDNGRSKKLIKGIDHKMSTSFQVVAIIEIEQCLNGTLGMDVFIDWAGDMGSVILTSEEDDYNLSSVSSRLDNIASCEWLISVGPVNSVTFWAIHCLDEVVTFRSPRVTLWTKRNPADFQAGNFSFYQPLHPEEEPILVKVVVSRSQLFGPPVACSLLQLLHGNSMNWWHFYRPSIHDAEQKSLAQASKNGCLSHFASGVLNLDGHTASILQLALHPYSFELELAVSLDSNGFLLFWSLPKNFNCTLEIQRYIHPTWKLLGKIRSQDLSVDLKYLTMAWLPLVLDDKPLLLLGYADGIDCFLINASDGISILCCKIFSVLFAGHNHSEGSPDHIFATPFPSFSTSFLLYAVWMKEFKALSWKVVLQSEDLNGCSSAFSSDSESVSRPENISGRISCSGRYSAAIYPASWNLPDSHTSKIILCVSVVNLDHSILSNGKHVVSDNDSCGNSCSLMATGCSDGILQLWKLHSAKSSESECIPWFSVGEFAAHDGPVNAVSLSNCGSKVATVSIGAKNSNFTLHIWTPVCFTGGGSFILEDVLLLSGPVVALKWLTIGNGKLLLGVCMPNEFHIYCQRRAHNKFLESDDLKEKHAWCCISISHSHHPCHEFLWGPMLTPVLLHENKISVFSEWLCETEYKHIGDISSIVTDEYLCCDKSLENNGHVAEELKKCGEKETGIFLDVLSSGSFMKNNLDTRKRLHNLMDFVERLCRPLESYHPWALLQYLYRELPNCLNMERAAMQSLDRLKPPECSSWGAVVAIMASGGVESGVDGAVVAIVASGGVKSGVDVRRSGNYAGLRPEMAERLLRLGSGGGRNWRWTGEKSSAEDDLNRGRSPLSLSL